jgi:copper chaperone CopZ
MNCAGCVATVEKALKSVPGVSEAAVSLAERTASVSGTADAGALIRAVVAAGYEAAELKSRAAEDEKVAAEAAYYRSLQRKTLFAGSGCAAVRGRDVRCCRPCILRWPPVRADRGAHHASV